MCDVYRNGQVSRFFVSQEIESDPPQAEEPARRIPSCDELGM